MISWPCLYTSSSTESRSSGDRNVWPFTICRALSVRAYISAFPPASECAAKTSASDHSTFCVHRPTLRTPASLSIMAAVCQHSDMYPPLNPKGRIRGSLSKLEFTLLIVIFIGFSFFPAEQPRPDAAETPSMPSPAAPEAFRKPRRESSECRFGISIDRHSFMRQLSRGQQWKLMPCRPHFKPKNCGPQLKLKKCGQHSSIPCSYRINTKPDPCS